MAYDGREVANFILDRCEKRERDITPLALQKIVFFCHVWSLISLKKPLVRHKFEAWEYGPVLPYLYRQFSATERRPIKERAQALDPNTGSYAPAAYRFDEATELLLESVVDFYSRLRPGDLVELSHVDGGPWHRIWNHQGRVNPGMQISNDEIERFYSAARCPFSLQ
jgi:uncharacterized phage-associated protein